MRAALGYEIAGSVSLPIREGSGPAAGDFAEGGVVLS